MSFGSDMGEVSTSSDGFKAELIVEDQMPIPISFDKLELESYIEGYQIIIRLGIEDNPGSKNELTLEAGQLKLSPAMTYSIGPDSMPIKASFGWEGLVDSLPSSYWGSLTVNSLSTDEKGKTAIKVSFSIEWETKDGKEMTLNGSELQLST
ncbi:hypothetical protein [Pseudomonas poae]|uniref:Uncharacterized protein n=1 Tax=Pseudomonas poae TaxID=200451 RepID=A0A2S9EDS3_9PSED|nr:hypothetical protein [Pseudomonas poae]PRA23962.1 hypothetical protein CQZ97_24335 [Pseudomonas poae]PRC13157.1 hypothetical protein CQZ99_21950 [Pseudomonas poae]